ncbi:hypothetical protein B0H19DRAFT_896806, partial [Mycena capillaripes]
DSSNYSCAYDATFTILSNVWREDPNKWTAYFIYMGGLMGELALLLQSVVEGRISLEEARNLVRRSMNRAKPEYFPYGPAMSSIDRVAEVIMPSKYYAAGRQSCHGCGYIDGQSYGMLESYMSAGLSSRRTYPDGVNLREWLSEYLTKGRQSCPTCRLRGIKCRLTMTSTLRDVPPIILLDVNHEKLVFSDQLVLVCQGAVVTSSLRGIIYGGEGHFTCRYVEKGGEMWFHDGITTGRDCLPE